MARISRQVIYNNIYLTSLPRVSKILKNPTALSCTLTIFIGLTAYSTYRLCHRVWSNRTTQKTRTIPFDLVSSDQSENQQLEYKRDKLVPLSKSYCNNLVEIKNPPKKIQFFSDKAIYYAYNAEGIRDYRWGCAWRAIQTCLSAYKIDASFEDLFHRFGPFQNLATIYKEIYESKDLPTGLGFAPYDTKSGWAEPFIGQMALHSHGVTSDLETVNAIPRTCLAPHSVFHHDPLTFTAFKERLKTHFQGESSAPVMIDDGCYAMSIVGIGYSDKETTLWIADPHIKEGVNSKFNEKTPNGLYTVTLNADGEQISCSLSDEDAYQKPNMFSSKTHEDLHFNKKPWMVLFPLSLQIL